MNNRGLIMRGGHSYRVTVLLMKNLDVGKVWGMCHIGWLGWLDWIWLMVGWAGTPRDGGLL
jgi:hypothetical protein